MTRWRQLEQARNLAAAVPDGPLLVWCGWGHLAKTLPHAGSQPMMARHFWDLTGLEPFALDQTFTVVAAEHAAAWIDRFRPELEALDGTGGSLTEEGPPGWAPHWADAFVLSLDNEFIGD